MFSVSGWLSVYWVCISQSVDGSVYIVLEFQSVSGWMFIFGVIRQLVDGSVHIVLGLQSVSGWLSVIRVSVGQWMVVCI